MTRYNSSAGILAGAREGGTGMEKTPEINELESDKEALKTAASKS